MLTAKDTIERYGGFHDARIQNLELDPWRKQIVIRVDDVNSNFRGLGDCPKDGMDPAIITLSYEKLDMSMDTVDPGMSIYDCEIGGTLVDELTILISPSGFIKLGGCKFELVLTDAIA